MTKDQAKTLVSVMFAVNWNDATHVASLSRIGDAFSALCKYAVDKRETEAVARYSAPTVPLALADARAIYRHLDQWCDGQQLLSTSQHAEAVRLCMELLALTRVAEAAYRDGYRLTQIKE